MISSLIDQLKRDEGVRLKPYTDTVGKLTIGVGRNLTDVGISESESDLMLSHDVEAATVALEANFPWTMVLDEVRKAVLINMAFNMGIHGLAQFRNMLSKVQLADYAGASVDMLDSKWAEQVGPRAQRLAIQIKTGEYQ